jgi:glycosyltransferase 2 family protein
MATQSTRKKTGKRIFNALRLLGVVLFVVILFRVDLRAIGQALLSTNIRLLLLGVFFQFIVLFTKGIRWHLMNDGKSAWKFRALSLGRFYESYAIGVVTPGRMGDLLKAGHESGRNNIMSAGFRVLAERGIDIGIFVILAGLSVLSGYYFEMESVVGWFVIAGGAMVLLISFLIMSSRFFTKQLNKFFQCFPGKWRELNLEGRRYSAYATTWILVLSMVSNLSYFVSCYFLGLSAGIEAGFIWISGAVAVSGLLNMLPVTIMGLGTRELIFLYVFQSFSQGMVLAFSFLVVLVAQIGGGLISLMAGQFLLYKTRKYNYD